MQPFFLLRFSNEFFSAMKSDKKIQIAKELYCLLEARTVKCDRERPKCGSCIRTGTDCVYLEDMRLEEEKLNLYLSVY